MKSQCFQGFESWKRGCQTQTNKKPVFRNPILTHLLVALHVRGHLDNCPDSLRVATPRHHLERFTRIANGTFDTGVMAASREQNVNFLHSLEQTQTVVAVGHVETLAMFSTIVRIALCAAKDIQESAPLSEPPGVIIAIAQATSMTHV